MVFGMAKEGLKKNKYKRERERERLNNVVLKEDRGEKNPQA
jgi:hypothetical protein